MSISKPSVTLRCVLLLTQFSFSVSAASVTVESKLFDLTLNEHGCPKHALIRSGSTVAKFNDTIPLLTLISRNAAGEETILPLSEIQLKDNDQLIARSSDGVCAATFTLSHGTKHLGLRVSKIQGVNTATDWLCLKLYGVGDRRWRAIEMDWLTEVRSGNNWFECRWERLDEVAPDGSLGGVALYTASDDKEEDDNLLHFWVEEKLPHPKIAGEWSLERASLWLNDWQQRFSDRGQIILDGSSIEELRAGLQYAERMKAKQVYLFTQTWRTDNFWPAENGHIRVNQRVFPRGEDDLRAFSDELSTKGMSLGLHYVSGGIGKTDRQRIGVHPDRRLASWAKGKLAQPISADAKTLLIEPTWVLSEVELGRVIRVDDELIEFGSFKRTNNGAWQLDQCRRGVYGTLKTAHAISTETSALVVPYNQVFVPENNSTLLEEMALEYADFIERCHIFHTEYDGAEIHCYNGKWGYRKFSTLVYQNLSHPVTAHDSFGKAPPCMMEYRFNSTRKLLRGSCSFSHGGWNAPVQLDSPSREASRLLDAHFVLSQGHFGGALGLSRPEPMFGVSAATLQKFGLTDHMIDAVLVWKDASQLLTGEQHEFLRSSFAPTQSHMPERSHHLTSPFVYVPKRTNESFAIVPVRVLTRPVGDIGWQIGQEHGPIGPRQFFKAGEQITLLNPERAQNPKFILRVLWGFSSDSAIKTLAEQNVEFSKSAAGDAFTSGNEFRAGRSTSDHGNLSLMPAVDKTLKAGISTLIFNGKALEVSAENAADKDIWECRNHPFWERHCDLTGLRAIGLEIEGDESGATLLIQLSGRGTRDYVVPINFRGRRWIEIPNGEVAWTQSCWGWRMAAKSFDYSQVARISLGYGFIPPRTKTSVSITKLYALAEKPATVANPIITINSQAVTFTGTISSGEYLEYTAGSSAIIYDANWNRLREVSVSGNATIPSGSMSVSFNGTTSGPTPWVELQMTAEGDPLKLKR